MQCGSSEHNATPWSGFTFTQDVCWWCLQTLNILLIMKKYSKNTPCPPKKRKGKEVIKPLLSSEIHVFRFQEYIVFTFYSSWTTASQLSSDKKKFVQQFQIRDWRWRKTTHYCDSENRLFDQSSLSSHFSLSQNLINHQESHPHICIKTTILPS